MTATTPSPAETHSDRFRAGAWWEDRSNVDDSDLHVISLSDLRMVHAWASGADSLAFRPRTRQLTITCHRHAAAVLAGIPHRGIELWQRSEIVDGVRVEYGRRRGK